MRRKTHSTVHSQITTTTHAFLTRLFVLPISRPLSQRRDGCLRGCFARERTRVLVSSRMTYRLWPAKPPLYLDSKVRAQRAFCYDINCRLSCANYLSVCVHAMPSIVIVDFATPKSDPLARHM